MRNKYYDDYDGYNDYNYDYDERSSQYNKYFEDDDDEDEKNLADTIDDDDILQCFDDARISTKATIMKPKKKKQEKIFNSGEIVTYRGKNATIVYGPYEKNYKQLYEIQTHDGKIVSATASALHMI